MRLYDELPTFWSNKFRSAEAICETLDDLLPNCSYAHHFDQFGSESVEQAACVNETAIREMLSPWLLDMDQLKTRRCGDFDFPKPRITIHGTINSKGNLTVSWEPTPYGPNGKTDFSRIPTDGTNQWGSRPNRELLFFRDVADSLRRLRNASGSDTPEPVEANLPGLYIKEIADELSRLRTNLEWHFETTWNIHATVHEETLANGNSYVRAAYIETGDRKTAREARARRDQVVKQIETFEQTYGFSIDQYVNIREAVPTQTRLGQPMSDMGRNRYVSKLLREEGFEIGPTTVLSIERFLDEIEQTTPPDTAAVGE